MWLGKTDIGLDRQRRRTVTTPTKRNITLGLYALIKMPILPCQHDAGAIKQIEPTKHLLTKMDEEHPEVLKGAGVDPRDYHGKLVFRSAVESIRGTYIASSLPQRHGMVADTLSRVESKGAIEGFEPMGAKARYDFVVYFSKSPKVCAALEVKGGEGNSVNISDRPPWAEEFVVWCHLDGAIVNQPEHGAGQIIFNRITNELVTRGKRVDAVMVKDAICGTSLRPCPKYSGSMNPRSIAPDVFLFPQSQPTSSVPSPPVHTEKTLRLPFAILDSFGVNAKDRGRHVYDVKIELVPGKAGVRGFRKVTVERWDHKLREERSTSR